MVNSSRGMSPLSSLRRLQEGVSGRPGWWVWSSGRTSCWLVPSMLGGHFGVIRSTEDFSGLSDIRLAFLEATLSKQVTFMSVSFRGGRCVPCTEMTPGSIQRNRGAPG